MNMRTEITFNVTLSAAELRTMLAALHRNTLEGAERKNALVLQEVLAEARETQLAERLEHAEAYMASIREASESPR